MQQNPFPPQQQYQQPQQQPGQAPYGAPAPRPPVAASPFRRVFVAWRLFLGLGLFVVGILVLVAIFLFMDSVRITSLLWGPGFMVLGVAMAVSAWAKGCTTCKTPLAETRTVFPLDAMPHLQNALGWAGQGNVEGVMQLQYASVASAPRRTALYVHFCPECRNVAEMQSAVATILPNGTNSGEDYSAKIPVTGPGVARVLGMIGERNEAITKAMYGGALPQ